MIMNRRSPVFGLTLWCLLSLWMFFGCLELAEQVQVAPETVAEDQEHQDLDGEALAQLVSGLKSDMPSLGAPSYASATAEVTAFACTLSLDTVHRLTWLMRHDPHDPPSRPLYQRFSVYRI
jgi:hypothetical protein